MIGSPDNSLGLQLTSLDVQAGGTLDMSGVLTGTNYVVASIARVTNAGIDFSGVGEIADGGLLSVDGGFNELYPEWGVASAEVGEALGAAPLRLTGPEVERAQQWLESQSRVRPGRRLGA